MNVFKKQLYAQGLLLAFVATGAAAQSTQEPEPITDTDIKESYSVSDGNITRAIEEEFLSDAIVPYNDVDIFVVNGIVELTGTTSNLLAKRRATVVAETVKGVRSVSNRIQVKRPDDMSGRELKQLVETAILQDPTADAYEVSVKADNSGHVTLDGEVDSWQEKQLTERVATEVNGVTEITNNLRVTFAADRPDFEIQKEIEARLDWSTLVDAAFLEVTVSDQDVELSGRVGSNAEKRQARALAWVGGVQTVDDSQLRVDRWERDGDLRTANDMVINDNLIKDAVKDAMVYDPRVSGLSIEPEVENSWVTLRGKVDTIRARETAETIAYNTVGVRGVSNMLKVRFTNPVSDEAIEETIEQKFDRDPWVNFDDTIIDVNAGIVRVTGVVDNLFEKARAEYIIQSTDGVKAIKNRLETYDTESYVVYDPYVWNYTPLPWNYYRNYNQHSITTELYGSTEQDRRTAEQIAKELFWSPYINHEKVSIIVENGIATLIGSVDSKKARDAATENALEGGANAVENKLIIEG